MKKLKIKMLTILGLFIMTACSTDDNNNCNDDTTIGMLTSGKWYMESRLNSADYNNCVKKSYIEFSQNGKLDRVFKNYDLVEPWKCVTIVHYENTYSINPNGNIINLDTGVWFIEYISPTTLIINVGNNQLYTYDKIEG